MPEEITLLACVKENKAKNRNEEITILEIKNSQYWKSKTMCIDEVLLGWQEVEVLIHSGATHNINTKASQGFNSKIVLRHGIRRNRHHFRSSLIQKTGESLNGLAEHEMQF